MDGLGSPLFEMKGLKAEGGERRSGSGGREDLLLLWNQAEG